MVFGCCAAPPAVKRRAPAPTPAAPPRASVSGPALAKERTWSVRSSMSHPGEYKRVGKYYLGETLGRGGTSKVIEGMHQDNGSIVAIKVQRAHARKTFEKEVSALTHIMKHVDDKRNIVQLVTAVQGGKGAYMMMERVYGTDLASIIMERTLDEATARWVFAGVAGGMLELKKVNVAHRDIKPDNVVVDEDKNTVKIIDFGLAKVLRPSGELVTDAVGTKVYAAPEVSMGLPYNALKADVYSFGLSLYAAVTGLLPCRNAANEFVMNNGAARGMSPALVDLILALTRHEAHNRMPLERILAHPWFNLEESAMSSSTQYSSS